MTTPTLDLPFSAHPDTKARPLADRMRPTSFGDVIGQQHLLGEGSLFMASLKKGTVPSIILWGPPGSGKTTIARILAQESGMLFESVSAISHATADLRKIFENAQKHLKAGKKTLLLVDEIHRFNRSQQDLFLPYIEDGTIVLVGATTENPSFELNAALLSRCKVLVVNRLDEPSLQQLLARAEEHTHSRLPLEEEARSLLCILADGDGRYLLNLCEELFSLDTDTPLSSEALVELIQKRMPLYDKHQDGHYNLISALHKSLRGSDVNAALYWFQRMMQGGEDALYILRRLVRFAVEDIGMADPAALEQALLAKQAYEFLGSPEGDLAVAQAVIYLATAPKSNAAYTAFKASARDAQAHGSLMPPKHILNAPTRMMKELGYGKGYAYDHDTKEGFSGQNYFPDEMPRQEYYTPPERGFEREIKKRLDYWEKLRQKNK